MDVFVNAAISADGKLSSRRREQLAISDSEDFDRMDRLRASADGVMVGIGTVLADDPSLTIKAEDRRVQRLQNGRQGNPARVIADSRARTPTDAAVLDEDADTYLLVSNAASAERRTALRKAGGTLLDAGEEQVDLTAGLASLEAEGIDRLMVEGGGELIFSLFADDLLDKLTVYVGSLVIGGRDAPTLADGDGFVEKFPELDLTAVDRLDDGVVLSYDVGERRQRS
jgi:2,5-diamino-6-(ribosylamino)-4(3H)-pyrimidinone 5'-phosphate reductase